VVRFSHFGSQLRSHLAHGRGVSFARRSMKKNGAINPRKPRREPQPLRNRRNLQRRKRSDATPQHRNQKPRKKKSGAKKNVDKAKKSAESKSARKEETPKPRKTPAPQVEETRAPRRNRNAAATDDCRAYASAFATA